MRECGSTGCRAGLAEVIQLDLGVEGSRRCCSSLILESKGVGDAEFIRTDGYKDVEGEIEEYISAHFEISRL